MRYDEGGFGRGQGRRHGWMDRAEAELRQGWERVAGNRGGMRGRAIDHYDREYGVVGRLGHGYDADLGGPGWRYSGNEGLARGWTGGAHRGPAPHALDAGTEYDGDFGRGARGYDRGLRGYDRDRGYDREMRGGGWGPAGHWGPDSPAGYDMDGNRYDLAPDPYDRDYRTERLSGGGMRGDGPRHPAEHRKTQAETDFGDPFGDRQARTPIRVMRGGFGGRGRGRGDGGDRFDNPGFDPYEGPRGTYGARGGGYNRGYDAGFRDWF